MVRVRLACALLLACGTASATPISYSITLETLNVLSSDYGTSIGDRFYGLFTVDDAILGTDGLNQRGTISAFRIQIEDVVWDWSLPYPQSAFAGFRGPTDANPNGISTSALTPGFDVSGGEIVNLRGGVFGSGDFPWIDFSFDPSFPFPPFDNRPNWFSAFGGATTPDGLVPKVFNLEGSLTVVRVPEPDTLCLLVGGLLLLAWRTRRPIASRSQSSR